MSLFTCEGLAIGVADRVLARDVSFALDPGDCLPVRGRSGSGKTTLLRTLAHLVDPVAGQTRLRGQTPDALGFPTWRRHVLYVGSARTLPGPTVATALQRPFSFASVDAPWSEPDARDLLAHLHLSPDVWDQDPSSLSDGQAQRVSLARGLLLQPAVLLLDEPTAALDPDAVRAAEAAIQATGAAILLVTHDPDQADRLGTRPALELADA